MWVSGRSLLRGSGAAVGVLLFVVAAVPSAAQPPDPPAAQEPAESTEGAPPPSRSDIRSVIVKLDRNVAAMSDQQTAAEILTEEKQNLERAVAERQQELAGELQNELESQESELADLEAERADAEQEMERNRSRLGRLVVDLYMDEGETLPDVFADLDGFGTFRVEQTLQVSISNLRAEIAANKEDVERAERAVAGKEQRMAEIREQVAELEEGIAADSARIAEIDGTFANWDTRVETLRAENVVLQNQIVGMLRLIGSPANTGSDPSIPIMGEPQLTAEQLTSWFQQTRGRLQVGDNDVAELAELYIEEGRSLGVRGDVAFIQAVLETGNFVYTGKNNFAGIGHCDSCVRGYPFETPRDGVRAQIQLLRAYADKNVTSADLPGGPQPGVNPDRLGVRGCCVSWWGLTGVWATALHYGGSILKMYDEAVLFSLRAQPTAPTS